MTLVSQFEIHYYQYLNHASELVQPLPEFAQDPRILLDLYRAMVLTRQFDTQAVSLQRTGQLGTYAASLGQEAVAVAIGHVMQADDVLVPMYREYGAQLLRGVRMSELLLYWGGDERGMDFEEARQDLPISVPVASHAPHAVGVAYAFKYRREARVAVCVVGDGATSKGDFYEAINAAGVWELPLVFVVNNNQWAISVPRGAQSRANTLAQKAIAAGFDGEQVDGNDIIAVRERVNNALVKARNGHGPTLIETLTYRLSDHTTADNASRYRSQDELQRRWVYDPIARLKKYLVISGYLNEDDDKELAAECAKQVEAEVGRYMNMPPQSPTNMFDFLYETLPQMYRVQREKASKYGTDT